MITKTQERPLVRKLSGSVPKLTAMERSILKWMTADPGDKVLDANVGTGLMMEQLRRYYFCEVCGVSDNMEHVAAARARLRNSDIMYAAVGDIPWKDDSFDTVLLQLENGDDETNARILSEAGRVLRRGGQLVLGLRCYPKVLSKLVSGLKEDSLEAGPMLNRESIADELAFLSFRKLFWQRTSLNNGVLIAWKPTENEEDEPEPNGIAE